jgi:hypothetical protein
MRKTYAVSLALASGLLVIISWHYNLPVLLTSRESDVWFIFSWDDGPTGLEQEDTAHIHLSAGPTTLGQTGRDTSQSEYKMTASSNNAQLSSGTENSSCLAGCLKDLAGEKTTTFDCRKYKKKIPAKCPFEIARTGPTSQDA